MWKLFYAIAALTLFFTIGAAGAKLVWRSDIPWTVILAPVGVAYLALLAFAICFVLLFRRDRLRALCWIGRHAYGKPAWTPSGYYQTCRRCDDIKPRPDLDKARGEKRMAEAFKKYSRGGDA